MDDLISRRNLMATLNIKEDCHDCAYEASAFCTRSSDFVDACEAITDAPSIDAVPVVRCKDCKHRPERVEESDEYDMNTDLEFPDGFCPCQCDDDYYSWMPKDDWFCANGERKKE